MRGRAHRPGRRACAPSVQGGGSGLRLVPASRPLARQATERAVRDTKTARGLMWRASCRVTARNTAVLHAHRAAGSDRAWERHGRHAPGPCVPGPRPQGRSRAAPEAAPQAGAARGARSDAKSSARSRATGGAGSGARSGVRSRAPRSAAELDGGLVLLGDLVGLLAEDDHAQHVVRRDVALSTVSTIRPWYMTLIRSDRSNTSWMSWLIRKIPMPVVLELADEVAHLGRLGRSERGRRLVHDQDAGVEVDGTGDRDRLSLAAGERLDGHARSA